MQYLIVDVEPIEALLRVMKETKRRVEIDWTNQTIRVLSEVKTNPEVMLSSGPMKYQDILFDLKSVLP